MSKFEVGTLVLLKAPTEILTAPLRIGMIGEVKDSSKFLAEIPVGEVMVEFPNAPSGGHTGCWRIATSWLVPLGGSDLLSDEDKVDNPYKVKVPETI